MAKRKASRAPLQRRPIARRLSRAYDRSGDTPRAISLSYIRSLTQNNKPRVIFRTKVREARINGTFDRYKTLKDFYDNQKLTKTICKKRKERREVLFATGNAGRGVRNSSLHNWTHDSYQFCR